ncbi:MAG: choice-of-anchor L domain-containing protein, partial [Flavobacterium sp.]|uniref:choice-of-anchor L domain-containing protein n=1 Tax=Flavobacterium sp. TaxID=239 RepID=UPI003BA52B6D
MKIRLQLILLFLPFFSIAQLFVNNTTFTPAELVQNTLLGNGVTVSNITFNGSAANASVASDQVGFFSTGINPTNLGIDSGIILTTGRGNVAVGPNNANNASNPPATPVIGDADLALLATGGINNKAVLEFDFIPTGNQLNFNFVFASEEYPEFVNSAFNDVFGFFLSGPGIAGPYSGGATNIALVPSTTTAITINNLNGGFAAGCPLVLPGGANSAFYVNNCGGASIQYDGFTTVLTASAEVQCGEVYHIKLAVANVGDNGWDSAVFLQANSFNVNPIDLGSDFLETAGNALCIGQTAELNSGLDASIPHQWYLDTVLIPGATGNTYTVTEPGVYTVIATPFGAGCPIQDSIEIEYYPPLPVTEPINLSNCPGDLIYDLTENTSVVLGSLDPSVFILDYATSIFNGENGIFIANPAAYVSSGPGEIVYVVVVDTGSGNDCTSIQPFQLLQQSCTLDPQPFPITVCDDISNDGIEIFDLTLADSAALNGLDPALYTVTYHLLQADANTGNNDISPANAFSTTSTIIYVRVEDNSNATTFGSTSFPITINPTPLVTVNDDTICEGQTATITATPNVAGTYDYSWTVPATFANPGNVATFTTTVAGVYSVIITNTLTNCVSPSASGTVTVNPNPTVTVNSPTVCAGASATVTATPGVAGTYSYAWTVPTGATPPGDVATFTTTVAGVYSVIITNTLTNCVSTSASGTVTINPNPTVTVNSPAVCDGASATVTATPGVAGAYSYAWTVPTGAANPGNVATFTTTIAGVYSVIITNTATGCISTSASGTVSLSTNPTVTINSPTVCQGTPATVTATPGAAGTYSYAWTVPTGVTNPGNVATFTTTVAGVYSVI